MQVHLYDGKNLETKCINFIYENALPVLKTEGITKLFANLIFLYNAGTLIRW